jgi:lipopolysaccharide export system protein LptA
MSTFFGSRKMLRCEKSIRSIFLSGLAMLMLVTPGLAATYKSSDGTLQLSAATIDVKANAFVAVGKAHVRFADPVAKTSLEADADKITVVVSSTQGGKTVKGAIGGTSIKSATLAGPVKMVYTFPDSSGSISKVTATADNADFDGATNMAHLTGHVKIVNENPAIFAEPAVMVGDKATVNLSPDLTPEDFRFRVESSPGVSTITVTPKPKEAQ